MATSCDPSPRIASVHYHLAGGVSPTSIVFGYCCSGTLVVFEAQVSVYEALDKFSRTFEVT